MRNLCAKFYQIKYREFEMNVTKVKSLVVCAEQTSTCVHAQVRSIAVCMINLTFDDDIAGGWLTRP